MNSFLMYTTDIATLSQQSEDQLLAHLTECYCHNIEHVPDEQQQELWLDICNVIDNIGYDPGLPESLSLTFDVSHALPVVVLDDNEVQVVAAFVSNPEDSEIDINNRIAWRDFYDTLSDIYKEGSANYHSQKFGVVFDSSFYKANPECVMEKISSEDNGKEFLSKGFKETLFDFIEMCGLEDSQVYHKAGLSRQVFNQIINKPFYNPSRSTVFQLIIALELSIEDANKLLSSTGLSFNYSDPRECIIRKQIEKKNYNLFSINGLLDDAGLKTFEVNNIEYK